MVKNQLYDNVEAVFSTPTPVNFGVPPSEKKILTLPLLIVPPMKDSGECRQDIVTFPLHPSVDQGISRFYEYTKDCKSNG